ncbi:hypothetical protein Xmau_04174 [Xenorhabdus mauleonii]|uniref:Predicted transcriptional regulator, contains an HTH and PUA-like domains n=1 Tax=Xenorhabdus mauleonii TaxID=351675 RepID=A0A1I3WWC7_9GAMM|nr:hypothetical protein [Xenorhabdus mauleonii]PHM36636.1 hypothetical protein Xmau_04174 [Xenorhabdus mauleonii]SFK11804.1 Predicted transcriptional regulator, contains an HTH and PUA-like domains [Xenorhabdus mauleonii]
MNNDFSIENIGIEDCIVLSLHQSAWEKILSGQKKYEFRRRFRRKRTVAFIYVTSPVKEIQGVIMLDKPIEGSAKEIAEIAEKAIPGNGQSVYDYFIEKDFGLAMPIVNVMKLEPVSLNSLREKYNFSAPQFYMMFKENKSMHDELMGRIIK